MHGFSGPCHATDQLQPVALTAILIRGFPLRERGQRPSVLFRLNPVCGRLSGEVQIWNMTMTTLGMSQTMVTTAVKILVTAILITAESPVPIIPIILSPPPHTGHREGLAHTLGHCKQSTNSVAPWLHLGGQGFSAASCVRRCSYEH